MNPDDNIGVLEAARAIAAGRRVDWAAIESSADLSESLAGLLRELKVVEDIAELHRSLPDVEISGAVGVDASLLSSAVAETAATTEAATWGSLRLLERVGQGAFGDVYRAWDPRLDREVALKLLRRPDSRHDSVGSLVVDEGRLLARVRHPNVVTVHGADRIDGRVGLWMEFVRGRTLEAVLQEHGPFSAQEASLIGLDICRALSAVHRAGLIHRDIKAHNVMREDGGRIVLMDFGTGREDLGDAHAELAGTPLYLAPEVFEGAVATARSDIYSVGILLYHLVTRSYPIKGRSVGDLRDEHAARRRVWLRDERPDLPDRFVQTVERALDRDPAARYESAGAMEAALARFVSSADAIDGPGSPAAASAPRRTRAGARSKARVVWLALAAAAVVGLAALVAPASWSDRVLGGGGGARSNQSAAAGGGPTDSVVVRRVTLPHGMLVGSPSFDGKLFSMVDDDGNVAIVDLTTGQARRGTTEGVLDKQSQYAEFTAISPDNRSVAYQWQALDGKSELRVIDIDGKRPQVLIRSDALEYSVPIQWSRDGKFILASLQRPDRTWQLAFVSAENGAVRPLKEMGVARPVYASISPDGEFVVYDAPQTAAGAARDIFIVRTDGSDDRRLVEHSANDADPVWTPDGTRVLFASDRSGSMDVWSVPVVGGAAQGEAEVVHRNIGRMTLRGLTDTGSYFYYATVGTVDVYQAELAADAVRNPVTVASSYAGSNISSSWSPDSRHIAYVSRRGLIGFDRLSMTLVIRDVQSGDQREFTPKMSGFMVGPWSPDGRYVLIGGSDLNDRPGGHAIDTESGADTALSQGLGVRPDWRPDGRLWSYVPGTGKLVARSVPSGVETVIADLRAEGIEPEHNLTGRGYKLAPDGATMAYASDWRDGAASGRSLSVKVLGGPRHELVRVAAPDSLQFQDWTPDGTGLIFTRSISKPDQPIALWRVSIHGGEPQPLGLSMPGIRDVSVRPDGKAITFTAGWPKNELWVMENFLTEK